MLCTPSTRATLLLALLLSLCQHAAAGRGSMHRRLLQQQAAPITVGGLTLLPGLLPQDVIASLSKRWARIRLLVPGEVAMALPGR